jgi:hypothetical protein
MSRWNYRAAACLAAFAATASYAQSPEEMKRELDALKAQVAAQNRMLGGQAARIAELEQNRTDASRETEVSEEVNRLSERMARATEIKSAAQSIIFSGEYRFRSYLEFGDDAAQNERDGYWNSSKIRIGILYEFAKNVSAYADIQSTFSFGHNGHSSADPSSFDPGEPLHICQAWVKTSNLFGAPELSAKLGRQSVTLGNQFQFGNADWYNGYFFDGARTDWNAESWSFTAMMLRTSTTGVNDGNQFPAYSTPANTANGDGHDHDEYYVGYFTLKSIKNHELDLYWIYANWHQGSTLNSVGNTAGSFGPGAAVAAPAYFHTLGARMGGLADVAAGLDWNLEAAYQTGELDGGGGDFDIDNFAVEGELGVTFAKENKIRAWIRGLYAEGPDAGETGYIPLAPTRHSNTASFRARYGQMDVFPMSDVFALTGGVHFDPAADWTIGLTGVWGQQESDSPAGVDDSYGFEIDLWAEYRYSDQMTFSGGVSFLFPDDQLDGAVAGPSTFDGDAQVLFWAQARLFF